MGAYDGKTTNFYSNKVGKTGLVIALEPDKDNYHLLVQRVEKNKLSNVRPLLMAIGKNSGSRLLTGGISSILRPMLMSV